MLQGWPLFHTMSVPLPCYADREVAYTESFIHPVPALPCQSRDKLRSDPIYFSLPCMHLECSISLGPSLFCIQLCVLEARYL